MLARRNFFNDFLSDPFDFGFFGTNPAPKNPVTMMKTDIKETESAYELAIDLPGFKKEDVQAELKDGYLTVSAQTHRENEEKDENGTYLRKERFAGKCSRSFYIGEAVEEGDISAKFEDGVLGITVSKKEPPKPEDTKRLIEIA